MVNRRSALRARGSLALVLVSFGIAGCLGGDEITDEPDIGGNIIGSWTAVNLGGALLPIQETYYDEESGALCLRTLDSVELSFLENLKYVWVEELTQQCQSTPPESSTGTFTGSYRTEGTKLFMLDETEPGAVETETGYSVREQTLTMRQRLGNLTLTSVFTRVGN